MSVSHHDSEHVRFRQSESKTICDKTMDNSLCTRFDLRTVLSDLNIYMSLNVECHLTHLKVCFHFIFSKYCFVNSFEKPPHVSVNIWPVGSCPFQIAHDSLIFIWYVAQPMTVGRESSRRFLKKKTPEWACVCGFVSVCPPSVFVCVCVWVRAHESVCGFCLDMVWCQLPIKSVSLPFLWDRASWDKSLPMS